GGERTTSLGTHRYRQELLDVPSCLTLKRYREQTVVGAQGVAVGGDPQVAVGVEGDVVRARDRTHLALVKAGEVGRGIIRVTTDDRDRPGEGLRGVVPT